MTKTYTLDQYLAFARSSRTGAALAEGAQATNYGVIKLNGEAGEVAEAWGKGYLRKECPGHVGPNPPQDAMSSSDRDHLLDELGDVLWYIPLIAESLDSSFEEVMTRNIEKLSARHGIAKPVMAEDPELDKEPQPDPTAARKR